jgi:hypothetical protein
VVKKDEQRANNRFCNRRSLVTAILAYLGLLFLYDPYIKSFINIGTQTDVHFWLIVAPFAIALIAILAIESWIGKQ